MAPAPKPPLQCVRQPVPHILTHFDWGSDCIPRTGPVGRCNHVKYGTDKPPEYRLQRITTPMMIATGLRGCAGIDYNFCSEPAQFARLRECRPWYPIARRKRGKVHTRV